MQAKERVWRTRGIFAAGLLCLVSTGCIGVTAARRGTPTPSLRHELQETAAAGNSSPYAPTAQLTFKKSSALSLDELLALASEHNPDLAISHAQAQAARGRLIQVGLYPNPVIGPRIDELGNNRNQWGSPGATINQEIVLGKKLQIAKAAAAQGVAAADWQAVSRFYDVVTRVRVAYYDVLTAEREVRTHKEIVELLQKVYDVVKKRQKTDLTKIDLLRAEVELDQSRTSLAVAEQRLGATWKILARVVGVRELPASELEGNLEAKAPELEWAVVLETMLARSSDIQAAHALQMQAERLLRRAQVEPIPNAQITVQPGYSVPDKDMKVEVVAGFAIPLFNRNQGNIALAQAELARSRAVVLQTELQLTEQLTSAFQRYQSAQQQVVAYREKILKNAEESLRLMRFAFDKSAAKFDLTAVLQAQHTLVQARLVYVQSLGEMWRAMSAIRGLVQE